MNKKFLLKISFLVIFITTIIFAANPPQWSIFSPGDSVSSEKINDNFKILKDGIEALTTEVNTLKTKNLTLQNKINSLENIEIVKKKSGSTNILVSCNNNMKLVGGWL